jgi:hypothetical protein
MNSGDMRRFSLRLTVAMLTFALGLLVATVRNDLGFRATLWSLYQTSTPTAEYVDARKCIDEWENASASSETLGWDLTYNSVLSKMKFCPSDALCEEWAKPAPPIQKHISEWQQGQIISSIEIELPDGHASMAAFWFIRTKDHAYYQAFYPLDTDYTGGKHVIPTENYDAVFETIACWVPTEPQRQTFGAQGYIGFLSMYKEGKSRQMLLRYEDFIEGGRYPDDGDVRPGPFRRVLEPLVEPLKNKLRQP